VLTYNQASGGNTYVTSVSSTPFGPFSDFQTSNVTDATWSGGDFHLFVDKDNTGYIIWTAMSQLPGEHGDGVMYEKTQQPELAVVGS
jgi:beta-xylosidase